MLLLPLSLLLLFALLLLLLLLLQLLLLLLLFPLPRLNELSSLLIILDLNSWRVGQPGLSRGWSLTE